MTPTSLSSDGRGGRYFKSVYYFACLLLVTIGLASLPCHAAKRAFTIADDIGLVRFANPPDTFSPDGRYFVVDTERGLLNKNRPESTLRIFQAKDVRQFLLHPESGRRPSPIWLLRKSTYKDGPIITGIRWLADSSGIAFLAKSESGNDVLCLAILKTKSVRTLTPEGQHVTGFDIRDAKHFVYCVLSPAIQERALHESHASSIVATGRSIYDLLFPEYLFQFRSRLHDLSDLWAVADGRRFRVRDKSSGRPVAVHFLGQQALALSPDGHFAVTAVAVQTIPPEWETLYPPSMSSSAYRIRAGGQDPEAFDGDRHISKYALVDLANGETRILVDSPLAHATGWWGLPRAAWSSNGRLLVLSNTFLPPGKQTPPDEKNRPCGVVVLDLAKSDLTCLEHLKGESKNGHEIGYHYISNVHFSPGGTARVTVDYFLEDYRSKGSTMYLRSDNGIWKEASTLNDSHAQDPAISVSVKQSLNDAPILVATDRATNASQEIWAPNPQLSRFELGDVSVLRWKDKTGRDWVGGLYKPRGYVPGSRYPLVIQTHGFDETAFSPGGIFATANAAQELAAAGIAVLQVRDCPIRTTPEEGPCQVRGYESAVEQLVKDGLVDPENIGIIGFSRTCYYVLEALTTSSLRFKAASITDGINEGYLQYITLVDAGGNESSHEEDAMIGAPPFGSGLQLWLERSPEFNMDKVMTPLQVVALGASSLLTMWEPYAALRYLNKPVDLIMLEEGTHILTNPAARMVSQMETVDWFCFWLKHAEDRDPAKAEQYVRWRELRVRQAQHQPSQMEHSLSVLPSNETEERAYAPAPISN